MFFCKEILPSWVSFRAYLMNLSSDVITQTVLCDMRMGFVLLYVDELLLYGIIRGARH